MSNLPLPPYGLKSRYARNFHGSSALNRSIDVGYLSRPAADLGRPIAGEPLGARFGALDRTLVAGRGPLPGDLPPVGLAKPEKPGFHQEYEVKTVDYEPVTRIESVPVTK